MSAIDDEIEDIRERFAPDRARLVEACIETMRYDDESRTDEDRLAEIVGRDMVHPLLEALIISAYDQAGAEERSSEVTGMLVGAVVSGARIGWALAMADR